MHRLVFPTLDERHMKCDHVAPAGHFLQTGEVHLRLPLILQGRIVDDDMESHLFSHFLYFDTHMSAPHHGQGGIVGHQSLVSLQQYQYRMDVLGHRTGVASWTVEPSDTGLLQIIRIKMVITYRRRGDKLHPAPLQQRPVTARTCTHDERIRILHVGGGYLRTFHVDGIIRYSTDDIPHIGYFIIYHNLHTKRKGNTNCDNYKI